MGFPGADHHIAEREWPMKVAMGTLAAARRGRRRWSACPALTDTLEHFLEPTFEESRFHEVHPSEGAEWLGLGIGGADRRRRHRARRSCSTCAARASPTGCASASAALHDFLAHKWYFDELYDAVVRAARSRRSGRFGRGVIETDFVQGVIVGGASGVVRAGSSFARAIQTGYLRGYALLLLLGVSAPGPLLPDRELLSRC